MKQVDVRGSFRVLCYTPGHVKCGVWINGGKSGDLVVRTEEVVAFWSMMKRGGFVELPDVGSFEQNDKEVKKP